MKNIIEKEKENKVIRDIKWHFSNLKDDNKVFVFILLFAIALASYLFIAMT